MGPDPAHVSLRAAGAQGDHAEAAATMAQARRLAR
jgi:hypothetical protein